MKKILMVLLVAMLLIVGLTRMAQAEETTTPAEVMKAMSEVKVFTTKGQIEGTWTLSFERNEDNLYPCLLDLGDGRIIVVPLTNDEVNELIYKSIDEAHQKVIEEATESETDDRSFLAKAADWVVFWD